MRTPAEPEKVQGGGALELHRGETFGEVSSARNVTETPLFSCCFNSGTDHALTISNLGGSAQIARRSKRGGARNSKDRESHGLTSGQIANLSAAERHARAIGLPFTRMITIHWEAAGVPLAGMPSATGRFLDLMTKTLARHSTRTAWVWVHENGDGKGGHCHLLAHVPAALVARISRLQRGWLRSITGDAYRKRVIRSKPIGGRLGIECTNSALHEANVLAALSYILKGATRIAAEKHGLTRLEDGGRIIGKRCGTSQNIGKSARRAAGSLRTPRARD